MIKKRTARQHYDLAYHLIRAIPFLEQKVGTSATYAEYKYAVGSLWLIPSKLRAAAYRSFIERKHSYNLELTRGPYSGVASWAEMRSDRLRHPERLAY